MTVLLAGTKCSSANVPRLRRPWGCTHTMLRPNDAATGVAENQSRQAMEESSLRSKLLFFGTGGFLTSLRDRAKENGRRQSIQNAPHTSAKQHSGMKKSQAKMTAVKIQKSFTCSIAYLNVDRNCIYNKTAILAGIISSDERVHRLHTTTFSAFCLGC